MKIDIFRLIWSTLSFALKTFWVCFFVSVFFVLVVITLKFGGSLRSADVASWVQAIGSIAAIIAAFIIGNNQLRKNDHVRNQDFLSRSAAFYFVVKNAVNGVRAFGSLFENGSPSGVIFENWRAIHCQLLKNSRDSMRQLPSYQLGSYELVVSFHLIVGSIDSIISRIEETIVSDAFKEQEFAFMRQEVETQYRICLINWGRFEEASKSINPSLDIS